MDERDPDLDEPFELVRANLPEVSETLFGFDEMVLGG